jgi:tRNA threonylcarbamoyladenosine biosynthesis protein TsaE
VLRVEIESASPEETEAVAGRMALGLRVGDVVTVSGELGTGKTTFVRGACRALGITLSAAEWGDLEPYFDDAIVFVEWPEAGEGALPAPRVQVRLRHIEGDRRMIELESEDGTLLRDVGAGC